MLPKTALTKSPLTESIRRHGTSAFTLAGTGLVLAATAAGASAAIATATAAPAQATPLSVHASGPVVLTAHLTGTESLAPAPAAALHAAAPAPAHRAAAPAARPAHPLQGQLIPHGTSGRQAWMPVGRDQLQNASTIVHQALDKGMGLRSAVIAVATAMQESKLVNINYGTSDSLGLFQQQPDCGWGTARQVMDPSYAADAFLSALRQHQQSDPGWSSQPLWASARPCRTQPSRTPTPNGRPRPRTSSARSCASSSAAPDRDTPPVAVRARALPEVFPHRGFPRSRTGACPAPQGRGGAPSLVPAASPVLAAVPGAGVPPAARGHASSWRSAVPPPRRARSRGCRR